MIQKQPLSDLTLHNLLSPGKNLLKVSGDLCPEAAHLAKKHNETYLDMAQCNYFSQNMKDKKGNNLLPFSTDDLATLPIVVVVIDATFAAHTWEVSKI